MMAVERKRSIGGVGVWLARLGFPPLFAAAAFLISMLLRRRAVYGITMPNIAALALLYLGLTWAFVSFSGRGERGGARAAALTADGLSLLVLSAQFGAPIFFGWAGTVMTAAGIMLGIGAMTPKPQQRFAQISPDIFPANITKTELKTILGSIIFPAALLETGDDGIERIVTANDPFAAILGRITDSLAGQKFADLISPDVEAHPVKFADAEWISQRTSRGRQTMFTLSPTVQVKEQAPAAAVSGGGIIDPDSSLFTPYYMNYKIEADIALCRRYKRLLSVAVLRTEYDEKNLVPPSDETRRTAFGALGRMLMTSLRKSDTAVRTGDEEVTIFLPETTQKGARTVVERMLESVRKIAQLEVPEIGTAHIAETTVTFFGDELNDLDQVLKDVESAKPRML